MASKSQIEAAKELQDLQNQEGGLDPKTIDNTDYHPNKRRRAIRRQTYQRWYWIRDNTSRLEAEIDWEMADKEYNMFTPDKDPDDWQSDLHLPDSFAAIRTSAQETVDRKARPSLTATDESDEPIEEFANSIMNYNMANTGYDYQYHLAKLAASIRGTAFLMDYWRTDKRVVQYPVSINPDGSIKYEAKEITDFDDDYTEWIPNEFIHIDEKADHIDNAVDMFRREILNVEEFHRLYDAKPGFYDTQFVYAGGDRSDRSYFKLPSDITEQDVEILHYYNRSLDAYWCVANNIAIYDGPLPTKHKELPVAVLYQYRIPGRFWGMGIPKVIHHLSEERRSIRNLNMDRQKIIVGGAFVHNNAFEIDDDDEVLYPGKWINVDTNGQPASQAVQQLQMSDVPGSYFKTEEILLEDMRRAHGIDDRIQGVQAGGTATEAAILKESSLKGINLISIAAEMDTVIRIGRLKWSNIQWMYGIPRMEAIGGKDGGEKKVYRTIDVQGKKFSIVDAPSGGKQLKLDDVQGSSALALKPEFAKYLEGNFRISVDADVFTPISKAIEQTKKTEIFSMLIGNPATMALLDLNGTMSDVLKVNNIKPDVWLKNPYGDKRDMMMLADAENHVMAAGQPLAGTEDATEDHTLVHLMFTKTDDFKALPANVKQIIMDHILQEHDNNPATGSSADLMGAYGLNPNPQQTGATAGAVAGAAGPALPAPSIQANTSAPQAQVADLQPTNFGAPER